ncbi:hypothetical protein BN2476_1240030 [Paraburkholderia piptadeniae]|uniref:Uncharacterized protein n=1 Tax=Paraburkholderia piptadeniae TaxID=1701573 RepID=A0A1N7SW36_9BURK|nr:hypothetical protein [Paraburkholderia piptadeniae]SIT51569.1 hypothetical protein BN2476_1240030 [Paraburkholderia piptadeniae]
MLVIDFADGIRKLFGLNLKTSRARLTEAQDNMLIAPSAKEPAEWIAQQATPAASIP